MSIDAPELSSLDQVLTVPLHFHNLGGSLSFHGSLRFTVRASMRALGILAL